MAKAKGTANAAAETPEAVAKSLTAAFEAWAEMYKAQAQSGQVAMKFTAPVIHELDRPILVTSIHMGRGKSAWDLNLSMSLLDLYAFGNLMELGQYDWDRWQAGKQMDGFSKEWDDVRTPRLPAGYSGTAWGGSAGTGGPSTGLGGATGGGGGGGGGGTDWLGKFAEMIRAYAAFGGSL